MERVIVRNGEIIIGQARKLALGWYFFPNNSAHKPSRKPHKTAEACIPEWAKKQAAA